MTLIAIHSSQFTLNVHIIINIFKSDRFTLTMFTLSNEYIHLSTFRNEYHIYFLLFLLVLLIIPDLQFIVDDLFIINRPTFNGSHSEWNLIICYISYLKGKETISIGIHSHIDIHCVLVYLFSQFLQLSTSDHNIILNRLSEHLRVPLILTSLRRLNHCICIQLFMSPIYIRQTHFIAFRRIQSLHSVSLEYFCLHIVIHLLIQHQFSHIRCSLVIVQLEKRRIRQLDNDWNIAIVTYLILIFINHCQHFVIITELCEIITIFSSNERSKSIIQFAMTHLFNFYFNNQIFIISLIFR